MGKRNAALEAARARGLIPNPPAGGRAGTAGRPAGLAFSCRSAMIAGGTSSGRRSEESSCGAV
jgi:hypothetical protein